MKDLYAALAKAQGEFKSIPKNKEVTKRGTTKAGKDFSYNYRYADLEAIVDHVKPVLSKYGLSITQNINKENSECETKITHESGQDLSSYVPIYFPQDQDMQKLGASITYARRYGLSLALGITTDDDLDANELKDEPHEVRNRPANEYKSPTASFTPAPIGLSTTTAEPPIMPPAKFTPAKFPLSEKQVKRFYAIASDKKWPVMYADAYVKATFAKSAKDLSRQEYDQACEFLEKNPCNDVLKAQYKEFCVLKESAVDAMKRVQKTGYVDHTAEPPFADQNPPLTNYQDEIPF